MRNLVIVGGGGHGRELLDVVRAINTEEPTWHILGIVDDQPALPGHLERLGVELLGPTEWLLEHPCTYALGIGTSAIRRVLVERLDDAGLGAATLIHPGASIGSDTRLDEGVVIFDRSVVTTNVTIGRHTHLNVGCVVQHDTEVGEFVQFSPGVFVNGDCRVGDDVFFGTGAILTRGCSVGSRARVGAAAAVLDDIEPGITVVGLPARPRGSMHP